MTWTDISFHCPEQVRFWTTRLLHAPYCMNFMVQLVGGHSCTLKIFEASFWGLTLLVLACTCVSLPTKSMWNSWTLCSYAKLQLRCCPLSQYSLDSQEHCSTMPRRFNADQTWRDDMSKNWFGNRHATKPCSFCRWLYHATRRRTENYHDTGQASRLISDRVQWCVIFLCRSSLWW